MYFMKELLIALYKQQLNKINENLKDVKVVFFENINYELDIELIDKSPCVMNSYIVYQWLLNKKELPPKIYFFDNGGLGFFCIQAKRVLGLFKHVEFEIVPIGKTYDNYVRKDEWSYGKAYDLKLSYMEDYCLREESITNVNNNEPLVSVCISHFNHGKYLPETLEALAESTYKNFEVIVVDSESNDPYSIEVFNDMENKYKKNFKFYHRKNESLGETRNHAVEEANGDYIIFFDSDNIPENNMIELYVKGMTISRCDCLTAHNMQFEDGMNDLIFTPIGPALAYGIFENCFGDSAFCIKKNVFESLGGFTVERLGLEDWEFLANLSIKGYKQDVVPLPIYRYRRNHSSMANTVNNYKSHNRVLRSYIENEQPYIKDLLTQFCIPVYKNGYKQYENIDETCNPVEGIYMGGIIIKFIKIVKKLIPKKGDSYNRLKKFLKR